MHHHIRGDDLADTFLDGVAQRVHLFEVCRSRHAHGGVDKVPIAGAPHTHAVDIQYAINPRHGLGDFLLQALRRRVQQGVERASAELRADPQDDSCNRQARQGVRVQEPGQIPRFAGPHQSDAGDHDDSAPYIG